MHIRAELIVNAVILLFVNDVDEQVFNIAKIFNSPWLRRVVDEAEAYSAELLEQNVADDVEEDAGDKGAKRAIDDAFFDAAQYQTDLSGRESNRKTSLDPKSAEERRSLWRGKFGSSSLIIDQNSNQELAKKIEMLQKQMAEMQRKMQ